MSGSPDEIRLTVGYVATRLRGAFDATGLDVAVQTLAEGSTLITIPGADGLAAAVKLGALLGTGDIAEGLDRLETTVGAQPLAKRLRLALAKTVGPGVMVEVADRAGGRPSLCLIVDLLPAADQATRLTDLITAAAPLASSSTRTAPCWRIRTPSTTPCADQVVWLAQHGAWLVGGTRRCRRY